MQTPKKTLRLINIEPNFARYELQHALTNGIYEPTRKIKDGELRLRKVVRETRLTWISDETGEKEEAPVTLTFLAPSVLNSLAESILLAIIKLADMDGTKIEPDQPILPLFSTAEG